MLSLNHPSLSQRQKPQFIAPRVSMFVLVGTRGSCRNQEFMRYPVVVILLSDGNMNHYLSGCFGLEERLERENAIVTVSR